MKIFGNRAKHVSVNVSRNDECVCYYLVFYYLLSLLVCYLHAHRDFIQQIFESGRIILFISFADTISGPSFDGVLRNSTSDFFPFSVPLEHRESSIRIIAARFETI